MSHITTGHALPRRTFLRGLGTAVALPFLEAMTPAFAVAATPITRVAFLYTANGVIMHDWTPQQEGASFAFTKTLQPVASFRDQVLVVSGLAHRNGEALGDGPGDHARAGASWLTGVHPKKTRGADIQNGMSVDQIDTPALVVDLAAYERNLARMAERLEGRGIRIRPHAKTHKSPVIAGHQMATPRSAARSDLRMTVRPPTFTDRSSPRSIIL